MPRKRKNKSVNTSGEREQKVHVSSVQNQTPSIPTIHGMESQLNNTNNSNFNPQHSTPVTPSNAVSFQNCQTNQFTPFGPQGPQSQFAGYVSPIPHQHQAQQQQPDMILDTRAHADHRICRFLRFLKKNCNTFSENATGRFRILQHRSPS